MSTQPNPILAPDLPDIAQRILALVDMFGGLAYPDQRQRLAEQLNLAIPHDLDLLAFTPANILDPETGLRFYPVGRTGVPWRQYARTLPRPTGGYSRDPFGYLCTEYADYIAAGRLYTGHVRHVDPALYSAVFSQPDLRARADTMDDVFRAAGILTGSDIANPAPALAGRAAFIRKVNLALAKRTLVEKYLTTLQKRRNHTPI